MKEAQKENKLSMVKSLSERMRTWTLQKGHPLVTVKVNETEIVITQQRFVLDPTMKLENLQE